jgi:hypothetical protein
VIQMYEPVTEGSYIKMIDMASGGGKMEVNILPCKGVLTVKRLPRQFIPLCDRGVIYLLFSLHASGWRR